MKKTSSLALFVAMPLFLIATVAQTGRYVALVSQTRGIEEEQKKKIEENKKLIASIAIMSSREKAAAYAAKRGLEKAGPERRVFVMSARGNRGGSDG